MNTVAIGMMVCVGIALPVSGSVTNLLENPGFDGGIGYGGAPGRWEYYTTLHDEMEVVAEKSRSEPKCVRMEAQKVRNGGQGILQKVPVKPGERYTFRAQIKGDSGSLRGSAFGQLVIEWQDNRGNEIRRDVSPAWGNGLSKSRWQEVAVKPVRAPKNAVRAIVGIHLYEGADGGKGTILIDDAEFAKQ